MKQFKLFPVVFLLFVVIVLVCTSRLSAAISFHDGFSAGSLDLTDLNTTDDLRSSEAVQWYKYPDQIPARLRKTSLWENHFQQVVLYETFYAIPDGLLMLPENFQTSPPGRPFARGIIMQHTSNPVNDTFCYYDVDPIKAMRVPSPTSVMLVAVGLLSLRFTRKLR